MFTVATSCLQPISLSVWLFQTYSCPLKPFLLVWVSLGFCLPSSVCLSYCLSMFPLFSRPESLYANALVCVAKKRCCSMSLWLPPRLQPCQHLFSHSERWPALLLLSLYPPFPSLHHRLSLFTPSLSVSSLCTSISLSFPFLSI